MAEDLINKLINGELEVKLMKKWLLDYSFEVPATPRWVPDFQYFSKCSQTDFLYHFLNCIHTEILCTEKVIDPVKKSKESTENDKRETTTNTHSDKRSSINISKEKVQIQPFSIKQSSSDDILCDLRSQNLSKTCNSQSLDSFSGINRSCSFQGSFDKYSDSSSSSSNFFHFSTPKIMKIQSDSSIDVFNASQTASRGVSPISPLYKSNNSYTTPKNGRQHAERGSEKITPLCLGDFIVIKKSSNKKKNHRNDKSNNTSKDSRKEIKVEKDIKVNSQPSNSFNFKENLKEIDQSPSKQFTTLTKEKCKILLRRNFSDTSLMKEEIEPSISLITFKDALDSLVNLYVVILDNDLVPNKTSEIYFIISLLLYKQTVLSNGVLDIGVDVLDPTLNSEKPRKLKFRNLFRSNHNVVYFACQVLKTQLKVLRNLDRHTLKLLASNRRLNKFVPGFVQALNAAIGRIGERIEETVADDSQMTVCFKSDTDNRENFPNDPTFHAFRKQRDLFYEILHTWTNKHSLPGWKFSIGLSGKIKQLFSLHNDPVNFMHFARLFTAQLLKSESRHVHSTLPNVDSDKLNKLINRMTENSSADTYNTLNALPSFTGHQEFYRDFIVIAANYVFNKHLYDAISSQILHLNGSNFLGIEHSEKESDVEPSTKKSYTVCIKSLRVLAKFLGFIESLPYTSGTNNYTESCLESHLSIRQQTSPNFNIKSILTEAVQTEKLILTIPWITEYLAMLDYITLRLPYFTEVIDILIGIYHNFKFSRIETQPKVLPYNVSLVKFCLGWLFELPHFPQDQYYAFIAKQMTSCTDSHDIKEKGTKENEKCIPLDTLEIVDLNVLYSCCPYLEEIRKLLSSNVIANSSSSAPMRHMNIITISTMESQLKEAFFNGQPNSVRKTVEFVSERVTSACVKHLCHYVVPDFKKETLKNFKSVMNSYLKGEDPEKEKNELKLKSFQMATEALKKLHDKCRSEMLRITKERIPISIGALLAVDVLHAVEDTCVEITRQMCLDRVNQWINTQVTTAIFLKDMDVEIGKPSDDTKKQERPVFLLPPGGSNKKHNPDTKSAAHILDKIRDVQLMVLEKNPDINEDFVVNLLNETQKTLSERVDVNECIAATICSSLVDLSLVLIAHNFDIINERILLMTVDIWKLYFTDTEELFRSLLCARTVIMFAQSRNIKSAWTKLATFVAFLIKHKVLSCDNFESQCIGIFQRVWDQNTLENITQFMNEFMTCYKKNGGSSSTFTFIIDFLADYCVDLDF